MFMEDVDKMQLKFLEEVRATGRGMYVPEDNASKFKEFKEMYTLAKCDIKYGKHTEENK